MATSRELGVLHEARLRQGTVAYYERGVGDPIVFLHGLLYNADLWRKVVPQLSTTHRCIAPDLPLGAHHPALHANADLTPAGLAKLVVEFLDELALERVTLVGNDTGGAIAQVVATTYPERVQRLVLVSCDAFDNFLPKILRPLQTAARVPGTINATSTVLRLGAAQKVLLWLVAKHPIDPAVANGALTPSRHDKDVRRDLAKVLTGINSSYTEEAAEKLREFKAPVLIVWAEKDRLFPVDHAERLASIMPHAKVVLVNDSYTFVPEDQPEILTRALSDFLADTPSE